MSNISRPTTVSPTFLFLFSFNLLTSQQARLYSTAFLFTLRRNGAHFQHPMPLRSTYTDGATVPPYQQPDPPRFISCSMDLAEQLHRILLFLAGGSEDKAHSITRRLGSFNRLGSRISGDRHGIVAAFACKYMFLPIISTPNPLISTPKAPS